MLIELSTSQANWLVVANAYSMTELTASMDQSCYHQGTHPTRTRSQAKRLLLNQHSLTRLQNNQVNTMISEYVTGQPSPSEYTQEQSWTSNRLKLGQQNLVRMRNQDYNETL